MNKLSPIKFNEQMYKHVGVLLDRGNGKAFPSAGIRPSFGFGSIQYAYGNRMKNRFFIRYTVLADKIGDINRRLVTVWAVRIKTSNKMIGGRLTSSNTSTPHKSRKNAGDQVSAIIGESEWHFHDQQYLNISLTHRCPYFPQSHLTRIHV